MNFQWYPGHMTKAKRQMQEDLKLVDMLVEILDARVPMASRNPDIETMGQNKTRVILLNKSDLADPEATKAWEDYFTAKDYYVVKADARNKSDMKQIRAAIDAASAKKKERDRKRGILNRPVRAMIVGIPNVGKSTFINTFAGKASAKTGNKPGVTKGKQWIRLNKDVELLDTPGILWPKFEDQSVGEKLAFIGSIKDELIEMQELSMDLISYLKEAYAGVLHERYDVDEQGDTAAILVEVAKNRNCVKSGGEADYDKAAKLLLDEFRAGKLGRITLELPE